MAPVVLILVAILLLAVAVCQLVCLVMVLMKMFENGDTGLGIACIVLTFCSGIGTLIAFVYGWIKSSQWGLQKVMIAWTACIVLNVVLVVVAALAGAFAVPVDAQMQQMNAFPQ